MDRGTALRTQIEHFKEWAASRSNGRPLYGEWETEYPQWGALYGAANDLLGSDPSDWNLEVKNLLLYAIARDNEAELIVSSLSQSQVDALASELLQCDEPDAKWQVAEQLGKYPLTGERKNLLLALASDTNEYVRRRAMNVLTMSSARPPS